MYRLEIITKKDIWNDFIIKNNFKFYSFLSSWEWGEVQILSGKEIFRFGIKNNRGDIIGVLPLIKNEAKRGIYLFSPHAPLILEEYEYFKVLKSILLDLKSFTKKQKATFIRFNSPIENSIINKNTFNKLGFINAPMHEHAEDTHLLNLNLSEKELLSNMKKGDRYYINRAIKEGVKIRVDNNKDHIEKLIEMHNNHAAKVGYHKFSEDFIYKLYKVFGKNIKTISASFEGKTESILMTIKFGETTVYYIAASEIKHPKFSPNYLCQWSAILDAKSSGSKVYNFWGVSPDNNSKHPIAGVTKFKRKFAGYDYSLLHTQDLIISPKYWFNYLIETIRRKKRGYYYKEPV